MDDFVTYEISCEHCQTAAGFELTQEFKRESGLPPKPETCSFCGNVSEWKKVVIPGDHPMARALRNPGKLAKWRKPSPELEALLNQDWSDEAE